MSKSLGNIVHPFDLNNRFGTDAVRYFLLREGVPHSDGSKLVNIITYIIIKARSSIFRRSSFGVLCRPMFNAQQLVHLKGQSLSGFQLHF